MEKAETRLRRLQEEMDRNFDHHSVAQHGSPLDPLVRGLLFFTSQEDLLRRISNLYQRLDLDESGAIDLEELNIGLKKIAREDLVQLSPDDFEAVTEHGLLLNEDKELTPAKFEIMMLNQVRGYSHRKVVGAMSKIIEDESVKEMIFALKIILSTVDHLLQNQQHELNKGKTPARLKSRKEVLDKLFHSSVKHAFDAWKKTTQEDEEASAEAKYASGESVYSIDPALRSQVDRMHERLEHVSVSIRQLHEERKADARSCQAMLASILSLLQEGSGACPAFKPPGQQEEGNGPGTAVRPGLTDAPEEFEVKAATEGYTRHGSADKVHEQESAGDAAAQRLRDKALFLESIEEYRKAKASASSHSHARLASLEPGSRRAGAFAEGSGSNIRDRLTGYLNGTSTLQTALSGSSAEGSRHKDSPPVEGGGGNAEPRDWRAASALTSRSPRTFSNHANRMISPTLSASIGFSCDPASAPVSASVDSRGVGAMSVSSSRAFLANQDAVNASSGEDR